MSMIFTSTITPVTKGFNFVPLEASVYMRVVTAAGNRNSAANYRPPWPVLLQDPGPHRRKQIHASSHCAQNPYGLPTWIVNKKNLY